MGMGLAIPNVKKVVPIPKSKAKVRSKHEEFIEEARGVRMVVDVEKGENGEGGAQMMGEGHGVKVNGQAV